jgi:predicted nucleic acid-binding protein
MMTSAKCLLITKGSNAIGAIIWAIAQQFSLTTLYDAAILAVAELESAEFWTADESLLNTLTPCLGYVQKLEA